MSDIESALAGIRQGLVADGYDLQVVTFENGHVTLAIVAGGEACADCLVPKEIMVGIIRSSLADASDVQGIDLLYPKQVGGAQ